MAFTINPDGSIKVDTADELRQVLALREPSHTETQPQPLRQASVKLEAVQIVPEPQRANQVDKDAAYRKFYDDLAAQPQQQKLLRVLLASPSQITDGELRIALGLSTNVELRGLLIGIIRRAHNRKVALPLVKKMERFDGGRRRTYRYSASGAFRRAMEGMVSSEKIAV